MHQFSGKIDFCSQIVDDIRASKGAPQVEILKTAKGIKADMIILETHGQNIYKDSLLGNTARRIVKDSKKKALMIHLP